MCKQLQKRLYNVKKSGSTKKKDGHGSTRVDETLPKRLKLGESSSEFSEDEFVSLSGKFLSAAIIYCTGRSQCNNLPLLENAVLFGGFLVVASVTFHCGIDCAI